MPRADDNPQSKGTLPRPELNPLLNPLLGAHMGRWAEVYFTSPPEKRDEAVLELLRELEGETSPKTDAVKPERTPDVKSEAYQGQAANVNEASQARPSAEQFAGVTVDQSVTCRSCGQINPPTHKFCGMCGADIRQNTSHDSPIVDPEEDELSGWQIVKSLRDKAPGTSYAGFSRGDRNPSPGRWARDNGPNLFSYSESAPYRHRIYVGLMLAIVVGALAYMAWRGTRAGSNGSRSLPLAAPAPSAESPVPSQGNPTSKPDAPAAANSPRPNTNEASPPAATRSPSASAGSRANSELNPVSRTNEPAPSASPPPQPFRGNGSDELGIAETYLNGTRGKAQDSAEAAKWLWRSVAKQNASAALVLSDLYLRGNGVAKSCDQARLLLDAAARKGVAGAAERLRNLPAFGCQ